jgi:hypothetical protein
MYAQGNALAVERLLLKTWANSGSGSPVRISALHSKRLDPPTPAATASPLADDVETLSPVETSVPDSEHHPYAPADAPQALALIDALWDRKDANTGAPIADIDPHRRHSHPVDGAAAAAADPNAGTPIVLQLVDGRAPLGSIVYFGDHIPGDVVAARLETGWAAVAVVEEVTEATTAESADQTPRSVFPPMEASAIWGPFFNAPLLPSALPHGPNSFSIDQSGASVRKHKEGFLACCVHSHAEWTIDDIEATLAHSHSI